jgi:thiol-disulfide isomerase/thioredoxin
MTKTNLIILIVALIAGGIYFFIKWNAASSGQPAPDFSAKLIDGTEFKLSDLKGKYVLIEFWGSWCPPCRAENPKVVELYKNYKGSAFKDADGFEIVTIALEKNDRTWRAAAEKDGFFWKYQIVEQAKIVVMSPLARTFGVTDLPSKFLIDPKGNLVGKVSLDEVNQTLKSKLK